MTPSALRDLIPTWSTLLFIGIRVVFIAVAFEFIAWYAGRRLEAMAAPFAELDQSRDSNWRARRRATLKNAPRIVARFLIYTVAAILVLDVFGVPILPLALAFGGVALVLGAALLPLLRDYAQGYFLLAEYSLAPGDMVSINGHVGQVEKTTLRATWLRDDAGCVHVLSNRELREVTILKKAGGQSIADKADKPARGGAVAFDPLAENSAQKTTVVARK